MHDHLRVAALMLVLGATVFIPMPTVPSPAPPPDDTRSEGPVEPTLLPPQLACSEAPAAAAVVEAAAKPPRDCAAFGEACSASGRPCCPGLRCAFDGYIYWCRY